jgi:Gram-negative bacterial TonB protein C-terminal
MKTKMAFNLVLAVLLGIAFTTQLSGQKLNTDRNITPINNSVALNQTAYFQDFGEYINAHLTYPLSARDNNVEGTVQARIVTNPIGEIISVKIIEGLGFGCDEAVVDVLSHMPAWNPSLKNGTPKSQALTVSVKFGLW